MPQYTKEFKIKVIKYYQKNSACVTIKKFNISSATLHAWIQKYDVGNMERKKDKF